VVQPAAGGGATATFNVPLRGTAATAVNAICVTTGANVIVSVSGYKEFKIWHGITQVGIIEKQLL